MVVVGSGFTGAMAAQTLLENSCRVLMLDIGLKPAETSASPQQNFLKIRTENSMQYKLWLGKNFEAVANIRSISTPRFTPLRSYVLEGASKLLPVISESFNTVQSLSYGGLGGAWNLGAHMYSDSELKQVGLPPSIKIAYQAIADRIGLSAGQDDALPYTLQGLNNIQEPVKIDANSRSIYQKYLNKKKLINSRGFMLGKPSLALLTDRKGIRQSVAYDEMEFYSNQGDSAYRPAVTIEQLQKNPSFRYVPHALLLSFSEDGEYTVADYFDIASGERRTLKCKKLFLCTGALSTARIVLRSMGGQREVKLPLLSDTQKFFTLIQPSVLGMNDTEPRTALAQLMLFHDPDGSNSAVSAASIYSYRTLMMFRIMKDIPLNFREGRMLLQYFLPAISIMDVHHPDANSPVKFVELISSPASISKDALKIAYALTPEEQKNIRKREAKFSATMRAMGCYTLRKTDPGFGSGGHYAGCLPFSAYKRDFHLHPSGRIYGTKNVYVADGSGFRYLPAKDPSLTLMANAHQVALNAILESYPVY